jgi:hypothetical protein
VNRHPKVGKVQNPYERNLAATLGWLRNEGERLRNRTKSRTRARVERSQRTE